MKHRTVCSVLDDTLQTVFLMVYGGNKWYNIKVLNYIESYKTWN